MFGSEYLFAIAQCFRKEFSRLTVLPSTRERGRHRDIAASELFRVADLLA